MSVDYIVASLPSLAFDAPAPISWAKFCESAGAERIQHSLAAGGWADLETQLRNAMAEARKGVEDCRPASGCSLYWKNRVLACFQEHDVVAREKLLDRVWWDAAGELTPPAAPLGAGALATYAIRLKIALRRSAAVQAAGQEIFDRLTAETKGIL